VRDGRRPLLPLFFPRRPCPVEAGLSPAVLFSFFFFFFPCLRSKSLRAPFPWLPFFSFFFLVERRTDIGNSFLLHSSTAVEIERTVFLTFFPPFFFFPSVGCCAPFRPPFFFLSIHGEKVYSTFFHFFRAVGDESRPPMLFFSPLSSLFLTKRSFPFTDQCNAAFSDVGGVRPDRSNPALNSLFPFFLVPASFPLWRKAFPPSFLKGGRRSSRLPFPTWKSEPPVLFFLLFF